MSRELFFLIADFPSDHRIKQIANNMLSLTGTCVSPTHEQMSFIHFLTHVLYWVGFGQTVGGEHVFFVNFDTCCIFDVLCGDT